MHTSPVKALVFVLVLLAAPVARAADLTFEERVAAQEAIERVGYAHQIGATQPFETAVPRALLEKKVRTYLRESAALQEYAKRPITAEALGHELERMERNSRLPGRLREIKAALGNDRRLILECLVRPALADRLARTFLADDLTTHAAEKRQAEDLRKLLEAGALSADQPHPLRTVAEFTRAAPAEPADPAGRSWEGTAPEPASAPGPSAVPGRSAVPGPTAGRRLGASTGYPRRAVLDAYTRIRLGAPAKVGAIGAVREERDAFVVRVVLDETPLSFTLATYAVPKITWDDWWAARERSLDAVHVEAVAAAVPPTAEAVLEEPVCVAGDTWDNGSLDTAPRGRWHHVSVWTGSEMIVWGGEYAGSLIFYGGVGGRYDPTTDTWRPTSIKNAPLPGSQTEAIWTGSEMILWGGPSGRSGRYNPSTNTWSGISMVDAPLEDLSGHTMVWTGTRMIVWGGYHVTFSSPGVYLGTGAAYDPVTNTWTPISATNAPTARAGHTAVWTGTEMVVWGGYDGVAEVNSGGRYDPATDTWRETATTGAATARSGHTAVWTGAQMIIWGAFDDNNPVNAGGRYDPSTDTWLPIAQHSTTGLLFEYSVVWTGKEMIVWGGLDYSPGVANTGYRYDPVTDVWTPTSTVNAPQGRRGHSAIWTGSRMIVWGGVGDAPLTELNSGGRYDPETDTWTPTYTSSGPEGRTGHTAIWTGNHMIVWGGETRDGPSGGRYDPATDTWTPTALTNAPAMRVGHSAIWTGSQMIVWGGSTPPGPSPLNSGGRYDPIADAWSPTSTDGAPTARYQHSAVWDGTRMIVWGGGDYFTRVATGGRYDPATDSWSPTATTGAPTERTAHSSFWTGTQMIVWGGAVDSDGPDTGARYDPVQDAWTPISTIDAPYHSDTGVWTGTRMILWGRGEPQFGVPAGIYDPATDTWSAISTDGAPPETVLHTAIWTGTEMIIWGGSSIFPVDTGARYDPATGRWTTISTAGAPTERIGHTAVWTGTEMIVWGGITDRFDSGGRYTPYESGDPPGVFAGIDITAECASPAGTAVALHATGEGCGPLTFTWTGPFTEGGGRVTGGDATVTLPRGQSTISLRADDLLGRSVTDSVLVSVMDSLAPAIVCPANVTTECPVPPLLGAGGATDLCDAAPRVVGDAPPVYPVGPTTVTFTATDASGNSATCQAVAAMLDTRPPVLTAPPGLTANATAPSGAVVTWAASAADACAGPVAAACVPSSGSTFPINPPGQNTAVVCQATDPRGNRATGNVQVHVKGAGEQLGDLAASIPSLNLGPDLTAALLARLAAARDAIAQGRPREACATLDLLSRKSLQTRRRPRIPSAQLGTLIDTIKRIRTVLACGR